jgi:hypothetical protein
MPSWLRFRSSETTNAMPPNQTPSMQPLITNRFTAVVVGAGLALVAGQGQVVLTGTSYSETFNSLTTSGLPLGWSVSTLSSGDFGGGGSTLISTGIDGLGQFNQTTSTTWNSQVAASPGYGFANVASTKGAPPFRPSPGFGPMPVNANQQKNSANRALAVGLDGASPLTGAFVLEIADTTGFQNFNLSFDYQNFRGIRANGVTMNVYYGFGEVSPSNPFQKVAPTTLFGGGPGWSSSGLALPTALDNQANSLSLVFTFSRTPGNTADTRAGMDNLSLSFTPVPEPEEMALVAGLGLAGWGFWRSRRNRA